MEILREYLKYDPESISGLVWIKLKSIGYSLFRASWKIALA